MSEVLRQLVVELGFKVDQAAIPKVDRALAGATKQASLLDKAMGSAFGRFAGPAALAAGAYKGVTMLGGALVDAGEAAVDFGRDMAPIQTLLNGDTKRVDELAKSILDLSTATGKSAKEIANATNSVLQDIEDSADTMKYVEMSTKGAIAGGTDAATMWNLLGTVMAQYSKTGAAAAQTTMDNAFAMRQFGRLEIADYAHGIGVVASGMKELHGTEEELFAIAGAAGGYTGPKDEFFTQLKGVMTALKTPTKELEALYKKLGITSIESAVEQEGLFGVMKRLKDEMPKGAQAFAKYIPDVRAQGLFTPLVTTLAGRYNDALKLVKNSAGEAAKANELFRGGLNKTGTELDALDKKAEKMSTEFGKRLTPMMTGWKGFWVEAEDIAIQSIDKINDILSGKARKGDSWLESAEKTIVRSGSYVANTIGAGLAEGVATATWDTKGAAAIRESYGRKLAELEGNRSPAGATIAAAAEDPAKQFARSVNNSVQIGSVSQTFVLPAGADPSQVAAYVNKNLNKTITDTARDLHNGASGDNP